MMDVDFLPEHLIIIGGSYIGLEFAQMYRRFGSQVTIVEKASRLIQREDEDISQAVQDILENEGIQIRIDADCIDAQKDEDRVRVNLDCDKGSREVTGSHLLLAVGRVPNTDDLGLDKAGIETNERGYIGVDDQLQTNVPGVTAMARGPSLTPPTTTMKLSPPICWMTTLADSAIVSWPTLCISIRRWAGWE
jgi:pyruvate/2-oxoglutarate dehydrogenase complex dihydrolipoamide dehydrogenase (E3) component